MSRAERRHSSQLSNDLSCSTNAQDSFELAKLAYEQAEHAGMTDQGELMMGMKRDEHLMMDSKSAPAAALLPTASSELSITTTSTTAMFTNTTSQPFPTVRKSSVITVSSPPKPNGGAPDHPRQSPSTPQQGVTFAPALIQQPPALLSPRPKSGGFSLFGMDEGTAQETDAGG